MQTLPIVLAGVRAIQARQFNNVRLLKLAEKIRRFELEATVNGDCVQVIFRHLDSGTVKIFSVQSFDELYDQIPCQYCYSAKPTGRTRNSLVCAECYCDNHGPICGCDCKNCCS